mgnify:CR=1 FL=1
MQVAGLRPRTISDYEMYVNDFKKNRHSYMKDINADAIYDWLVSMNIKPQTKLIRLMCMRAFLERCFDNGLLRILDLKSVKDINGDK